MSEAVPESDPQHAREPSLALFSLIQMFSEIYIIDSKILIIVTKIFKIDSKTPRYQHIKKPPFTPKQSFSSFPFIFGNYAHDMRKKSLLKILSKLRTNLAVTLHGGRAAILGGAEPNLHGVCQFHSRWCREDLPVARSLPPYMCFLRGDPKCKLHFCGGPGGTLNATWTHGTSSEWMVFGW